MSLRRAVWLAFVAAALAGGAVVLSGSSTADAKKKADDEPIYASRVQYYTIDTDVDKPDMRCDGDSTIVTIRATWKYGDVYDQPVVGYNQKLYATEGTRIRAGGRWLNRTEQGYFDLGKYDATGTIRFRIYPVEAGENHDRAFWSMAIPGPRVSLIGHAFQNFACDFPQDTSRMLSGDMWIDTNANGVEDSGERPARRTTVRIGRGMIFSLAPTHLIHPWHTTYTDGRGRFGFDGAFYGPWEFCLAPGKRDLLIASMDGVPIAPTECVIMPHTSTDDHHSIGVVKRDRVPSPTSTPSPPNTPTPSPTLTPSITPAPSETATPTTTPTLPPSQFELHVDCDASTQEIDETCEYPGGTTNVNVAVVAVNNSNYTPRLVGWSFELTDDNKAVFDPATPAMNVAAFPPATWSCFAIADRDNDGDANTAQSLLSCFNAPGAAPVSFGQGETLRLATATYAITGDGQVSLSPHFVSMWDESIAEVFTCAPVVLTRGACFNATITVGEP
jgi:hypothetical protein